MNLSFDLYSWIPIRWLDRIVVFDWRHCCIWKRVQGLSVIWNRPVFHLSTCCIIVWRSVLKFKGKVFYFPWSISCGHTSFIISLRRTLCERLGKQSWTCRRVRKWPRAVWYRARWPWWTPSRLFLPLAARGPFCVCNKEKIYHPQVSCYYSAVVYCCVTVVPPPPSSQMGAGLPSQATLQ